MENFNNFEAAERYLRGEMTEEEMADFKTRLQQEPELANETRELKALLEGVEFHGYEVLKSKIQAAREELKQQDFFKPHQAKLTTMKQNKFPRWALAAAAVAVIAIALYFLFPGGSDPAKAFAQYYKPENTELPEILDRMEAKGLATPGNSKEDSLAQALKMYEEYKYDEARTALNLYLEQYPDDTLAQLYMGLSLLQLSEYAKASRFLRTPAESEGFEQQNTAKWYLALCYSQFNTAEGLKDARKLLSELAADPDSGYYKEATGYLRLIGKGS